MKIKDTLDLCGWELWNFCIQNHQNLEGLLDLGAGRKVFYTGNDQGKNGREVIYDGSKWKVSAYMSDVENVESNLSTLTERVNAFLDGEVNSNEVLDNLKEIQAFLDAYPEATSLVQILDAKLDKTGGTIKKAEEDNAPLFIENVGTSWTGIGFKNKNGILGFLGANDGTPVFVDSSFASHTLLHSGNVGEYKAGGIVTFDSRNKNYAPYSNEFSKKALTVHFERALSVGYGESDYNVNILHISPWVSNTAGAEHQLAFRHDGAIGYRYGSTIWSDWKTIAFTDSDITGNAATATVAESARTLLSAENFKLFYTYPNINTWSLGYYTHHGNLDFETLSFRYDSGYNTAMLINSSGNVLIGTTEDNGSEAKLQVDGAINITDNYKIGGLDVLRVKTDHLAIGEETAYYSSLPTKIYGTRITLQYGKDKIGGLFLNESGNVTIGDKDYAGSDYKLQIKGDLYVEGNIIATKEVSAGGAATEGNGGAGGFSLYESWGTSAPTEPLALGANLGYELKTRVEDLELAKTKVEISDTLVSGKPIGAITIDGNKTNLFAPATYAWSEITGTENVLTTAGGTIKSQALDAFTINRNEGGAVSSIAFKYSDSLLYGYLGFDDVNNPIWMDSAYNRFPLLHSGNVGEYKAGDADKLGGVPLSQFVYGDNATKTKGISEDAFENPLASGFYAISNASNLPTKTAYNTALHVSYNAENIRAGFDFLIGDYKQSPLYFRPANGDGVGDWKTIAFTDSNVASATKLQTARTIWGQSFDGTGDVSGALYLGTGTIRSSKSGTDRVLLDFGSAGDPYIGYGTASAGIDSHLCGNNIYLHYGTSRTNGLILNSSGNVTIGASDLAGTSAKLYVNGDIHLGIARLCSIGAPYSASDPIMYNRISIGRSYDGIKYYSGSWTEGVDNISHEFIVGFENKSALAITNGGNVIIGTTTDNGAKLQVNGDATATLLRFVNNDGTTGSYIGRPSTGNDDILLKIPTANDFYIATNGTERMRINSSGNVTIGAEDKAGTDAKLYVDGHIKLGASGYLYKNDKSVIDFAGDAPLFGYGTAAAGLGTKVYGFDIRLYYGGTTNVGFILDSSGNVTIGASDLASTCKLAVTGDVALLNPSSTLNASSSKLLFHSAHDNISGPSIQGIHAGMGYGAKHLVFNQHDTNGYTEYEAMRLTYDGKLLIGTTTDNGAKLQVNGDLHVSGNIIADGEVSAGGAGTEGGNTGGGGTGTIASPFSRTFTPNEKTSFTFSHDLPYYDVVVQVYEWDNSGMCWNMVLADIEIQNNDVTVTLGRKENVEHKIVVR